MIFTSSWLALAQASSEGPLGLQPVRISRGAPRFWPSSESFPAIDVLMPEGFMFSIKDPEKFGRAYRRKLYGVGLERVARELAAIPGPIALACFESNPAECHRGVHGFAGWWEAQTGVRVPDLGLVQRESGSMLMADVTEGKEPR